MKKILFIAGLKERYYYGPFINASLGKDLEIYVCDPSRFPQEGQLHVSQDSDGTVSGFIDTVLLNKEEMVPVSLSINDIYGAWYIRENHEIRETPSGLASRFIRNETRQAFRALLSTLSCKWVNNREAIERINSNKLYQQMLAAQSGLAIPQTVISNSPEDVIAFSDRHDGLLAKSIGYIQLDEKSRHALYSERFSREEIGGAHAAIRCCPLYAQEYVQKRYEYRVMVIGSEVLACRINSQASPATAVDWRHYDFDRVEHRQTDLPSVVKQSLFRFMEAADLRYGAIDLIEDPDGKFVFLEVNPSGQWGWIADLAGLHIADAVARMLERL